MSEGYIPDGGSGAGDGSPDLTDSFGLQLTAPETNEAPTDTATEMLLESFMEDDLQGAKPVFHHDSNNSNGSSSSSITLNRPTATADGDLLIAVINLSAAAGALSITPPAGWTELTSEQSVTDSGLGITLTSQAFAKIAASEPTTWTWTYTPNADSRTGDVMAFTGGKLPADIAVSSSATRVLIQNYGTLSTNVVTGQEVVVAMCSLAQDTAQSGWDIGPTNLTNRTGDINPAGSNKADMQIWSGLNGSAVGQVLKTESDVYISFVLIAPPADNPIGETALLSISGSDMADTNDVQTEARTIVIRSWATGCSSNTANLANPGNANGANDGATCNVKTNNALGDLTNPVTLSTGSMNFPGGTVTFALIRVWFRVPARATSLDTITISYNTSGVPSGTLYTHSGTAEVNHLSGDFTFDISGLSNAELAALQLVVSYTAAVVAVPETSLNIDSWSIDATETI